VAFGVRDFERVSTTFANELLVAIFVMTVFVDGRATFGADGFLHDGTPPLPRYGGGGGFFF